LGAFAMLSRNTEAGEELELDQAFLEEQGYVLI
jgi:hypothetical protein